MTDTLSRTSGYEFAPELFNPIQNGDVFLALSKPGFEHGRHALLGDELVLRFDGLGDVAARCVLRARVYLTTDGLTRVLGPFATASILSTPEGEGMAALLQSAEQGSPHRLVNHHKLARALGEADYDGLWSAQKKLKLDKQHRAVREVVGWRLA